MTDIIRNLLRLKFLIVPAVLVAHMAPVHSQDLTEVQWREQSGEWEHMW